MNIHVKYFASLRESAGKSSEDILTEASTVETLFSELNLKYHFSVDKKYLKVAVNKKYQSFDTALSMGDTVVFIPPVAGG